MYADYARHDRRWFSSPSIPKPQPAPAAPVQDSAATAAKTSQAEAAERMLLKSRKGRGASILAQTPKSSTTGTRRTSLLGGGVSAATT